jgi:hypothetical protein
LTESKYASDKFGNQGVAKVGQVPTLPCRSGVDFELITH